MADRSVPRPPQLSRRTKTLLGAGVAVLVLLLVGARLVDVYVDWEWYGEVGFRGVFTTALLTRVIQFVVAGVFVGGLVALNLAIAYRVRPVFVPVAGPDDPVARYRTVVVARLRWFALGLPLVVGLIAGISGQADWQTTQLFLHGVPFGQTDPVFAHDIGFYVFELPFYRALLGWVFVGVALSFAVSLVAHYVLGGIRLAGRQGSVAGPTRAHLAVLAGTFVLAKAVGYLFDRYELLFDSNNDGTDFFGAGYTALNATMTAKLILLIIAIICAGAFFAAVVLRNLQIPAIATVLMVLSSIIIGSAYPAIMQQFSVKPNAIDKEAQPIARNIAATRSAFALNDVSITPYSGNPVPDPGAAVRSDPATVPNIRLLDPNRLSRTFTQQQQGRNFYGFNTPLDVDRYTLGGREQDYIVAAREIDPTNFTPNQQNWINRHLVYTHGNGFVAAPANTIDTPGDENSSQGGYPQYQVSDIDRPGPFGLTQPRIYYGELVNHQDDYAIVGADPGAPPREYDTDTRQSTYAGSGGVPLNNAIQRLAFATYYGERNILFNGSIGDSSRILYHRSPLDRVHKAAPWLQLDNDPYPAVVDGRLQYIVDGYTTLPRYPSAQQVPLDDATRDSATGNSMPPENVGYMRNSVKATVDAYTGQVRMYAVDEQDPVLRTWRAVFPGSVEPGSAVSPDLRAHFRYPGAMFKVQRDLLTRYHVSDPRDFYNTVGFWDIPSDPTVDQSVGSGDPQPPYYLVAGNPAPGAPPTPQFQLTSALVSLRREFLSAYMSVSSDPGSYGHITVLQTPTETQTNGPQQVQSRFTSSPQVSSQLNLLRSQGTRVLNGNMLTLPVAGSLLYVEPVYIERSGQESSFPQLSKVLVNFGDRIGYADTLSGALTQVFGSAGGAPGAATGPAGATAAGGGTGEPGAPPPGPGAPGTNPEVSRAVDGMNGALDRLRSAQQRGDFAGIGQAQQDLAGAIEQYRRLVGTS